MADETLYTLDKLLIEYADKFDDTFPIFCLRATPNEELISILRKCIDEGKPYEFEYDPSIGVY